MDRPSYVKMNLYEKKENLLKDVMANEVLLIEMSYDWSVKDSAYYYILLLNRYGIWR